VDEGPARDVGRRYLELNFSAEARAREELEAKAADGQEDAIEALRSIAEPPPPDPAEGVRQGDGRAEVQRAHFEDLAGNHLELLTGGEQTVLVLRARFRDEVQDPVFAVSLRNDEDQTVFARSTDRLPPGALFRPGEEVDVRFTFPNYLAPGRYELTATISRAGSGLAWIDHRERFLSIVSATTEATGALVDLPCEVEVVRGALVPDSVN
jgi:hypothetical protein